MRTILIAAALISPAWCGLGSPTPSAPSATAAPQFVRQLKPGGVDPTLRVTTHGETNHGIELSLDIFDGHLPPLPSREACADVGIDYEVILTFRKQISDFHISAADSEEPQ